MSNTALGRNVCRANSFFSQRIKQQQVVSRDYCIFCWEPSNVLFNDVCGECMMRFCGRYDSGSLYIEMRWPEDRVWHQSFFGDSLTFIGEEGFFPIKFSIDKPPNDRFIAVSGALQATDEGNLFFLADSWRLTRDPRKMVNRNEQKRNSTST